MANIAPVLKSVIARVAKSPRRSQISAEPSTYSGDPVNVRSAERAVSLSAVPNEPESRSSQKTRAALLALDDCSTDTRALHSLWEENHLTFESQMKRHLDSPASPALRMRVLSAVVSVCKFYCDEIDDPKAWVARCANLETRRVALQLHK